MGSLAILVSSRMWKRRSEMATYTATEERTRKVHVRNSRSHVYTHAVVCTLVSAAGDTSSEVSWAGSAVLAEKRHQQMFQTAKREVVTSRERHERSTEAQLNYFGRDYWVGFEVQIADAVRT